MEVGVDRSDIRWRHHGPNQCGCAKNQITRQLFRAPLLLCWCVLISLDLSCTLQLAQNSPISGQVRFASEFASAPLPSRSIPRDIIPFEINYLLGERKVAADHHGGCHVWREASDVRPLYIDAAIVAALASIDRVLALIRVSAVQTSGYVQYF